MREHWRLWVVLWVGFVFHMESEAREAGIPLTVRITTVKESDWQRETSSPTKTDGLRQRLQAHTLAELTGTVKAEGTTILRSGQEKDFTTAWHFDRVRKEILAEKTKQEFIGTELQVERVRPREDTPDAQLHLTLTHDLQPPQFRSLTYAAAAVGAERDKHSVPVPRFERLRWQGEVPAGSDERVLASFYPSHDSSSRIVVFCQRGSAGNAAPVITAQEVIYRVPELEMIDWLLKAPRDDAAVAAHLQEGVAAGRASVISSTTLSGAPGTRTEMQSGIEHWLTKEVDQYFDQLYLLPVFFETVLEGTKLSFDTSAPPGFNSPMSDGSLASFSSMHVPRAPLTVQWPASWLRVRDDKGVSSKAIHGWMDWHDHFEQEIAATLSFHDEAPHLVAMMPPADQVWGAERQGRWLDVTMIGKTGVPIGTGPSARTSPRSMLIGLALSNKDAQALLATRSPEEDDALLQTLLASVKEGRAQIVTCTLTSPRLGSRTRQTSARIHAYPTEMPSMPSAWADEPVGVQVELDGQTLSLNQHLAPPARTEWKLAKDVPEAIMWEPRFRKFSLMSTTAALTMPGTHLLAAAHIPAVMTSADLPADETVLLFSHLDSKTDAPTITRQDVEIETLTFEIPVQDAAAWQVVKSADFATFTQQHLKSGRAKLQSQTLLRTQPVPWAKLSVVEEYLTATEFDPPSVRAPSRMRPTALQELPVGLRFKAYLSAEDDGTFVLNFNLQHSTAKPIEPSLEKTLQIPADNNMLYPGAKHEFDEWAEEEIHISPGVFHQVGFPTPPGGVGFTRITWVRVRSCGPPLKQ